LEDVEIAVELLLALVFFFINWDKFLIEPCHSLEFSGMMIDAKSGPFRSSPLPSLTIGKCKVNSSMRLEKIEGTSKVSSH
jgi:hypothetical protein